MKHVFSYEAWLFCLNLSKELHQLQNLQTQSSFFYTYSIVKYLKMYIQHYFMFYVILQHQCNINNNTTVFTCLLQYQRHYINDTRYVVMLYSPLNLNLNYFKRRQRFAIIMVTMKMSKKNTFLFFKTEHLPCSQ